MHILSLTLKRLKMVFSSSSSSIILLSLLVVCVVVDHEVQALISLPKNVSIPAVIVFGDSIVDPGNNNYISTTVKCNFRPYGRDFMGGIPTGRFSNGKIPSDLIVEELGIKELLPAYLDPTLKPADLITGVSFASGSSGYDSFTARTTNVLSLSDQLNLFKEYVRKLKAISGKERTASIIKDSLYIVVAGSNDIAITYFTNPLMLLNYDIYTDLMLQSASTFLQELYGLGARRIGVFSTPPVGCVPWQRTVGGGAIRECAEKFNRAGMLFNSKLSNQIDILNNKLPRARIIYIDIYNPFLDLINNANRYGFEVVTEGCCGTGQIEVSLLCNELNPHTCENESNYVFWDSYHPTQRAYKVLLGSIFDKYIGRFF